MTDSHYSSEGMSWGWGKF